MKKITKNKIIQIFSDGSVNFDYTIIKRLRNVNFHTKDHKNFFLNQKALNVSSLQSSVNFKTKYI